jgi:alpha-glucosidase
MVKKFFFCLLIALPLFHSCKNSVNTTQLVLPSPDSRIHVYFNLNNGEPYYLVYFKDRMVVDWSLMGISINDQVKFTEGLSIIDTRSRSVSSGVVLEMAGGVSIQENYNELVICLQKQTLSPIVIEIVLRAYNEGVGISYNFEINPADTNFFVVDETQIDLTGDDSDWRVIIKTDSISTKLKIATGLDYPLPVAFESADEFTLMISEIGTSGYPVRILEKRSDAAPEFRIKQSPVRYSEVASLDRKINTPWQFFLIFENDK